MIENDAPLNQLMKESMNLINSLKDGGVDSICSLPSIACVGIQSSGKSSVLEGLIGLDILPRSDGLCTRTPIELRLNTSNEEYAVIKTISNANDLFEIDTKVNDFQKLKQMILSQTDIKAGTKKNIVDKPIIVTVYSPKCPDLTVIDLPGIVNNPLEGSDQPNDIDEVTWKITKKYCEREQTIILCVLASGVDITTSEILRYTKKIDPEGKRTIGVLTKLDLMNEGTSAKEALLGQQVKLNLGFFAVRNRTEKELKHEKVSIEESYQRENNYFSTHSTYSKMMEYCGTPNLLMKLSKTLYVEIKKNIPNILAAINGKIQEVESILKELGPGVPTDFKHKKKLLNGLTNKFCSSFDSMVKGRYITDITPDILENQNSRGGFDLVETFDTFLQNQSSKTFRISDSYKDSYITSRIKTLYGDSFRGKVSTHAFLDLLIPQIEKLRIPINEFLLSSEELLCNISSDALKPYFYPYPLHILGMGQYTTNFIKKKVEECRVHLMRTIDVLKYPFTNDMNYHYAVDQYLYERSKKKLGIEINVKKETTNNFNLEMESENNPIIYDTLTRIETPKRTKEKEIDNEVIEVQDYEKALKTGKLDEINQASLTLEDMIDEMRFRMDNFYKMIIIGKLRDIVPASVNSIIMNETCNEIRQYLMEIIEDNDDFVETLLEEDELHQKRLDTKAELEKLVGLRQMILVNPSGKNKK